MQVQCAKCSQPISLTDIIESNNGHLSHIDCKRPHVLTPEERALGLRLLLGSRRRPMPGL